MKSSKDCVEWIHHTGFYVSLLLPLVKFNIDSRCKITYFKCSDTCFSALCTLFHSKLHLGKVTYLFIVLILKSTIFVGVLHVPDDWGGGGTVETASAKSFAAPCHSLSQSTSSPFPPIGLSFPLWFVCTRGRLCSLWWHLTYTATQAVWVWWHKNRRLLHSLGGKKASSDSLLWLCIATFGFESQIC